MFDVCKAKIYSSHDRDTRKRILFAFIILQKSVSAH